MCTQQYHAMAIAQLNQLSGPRDLVICFMPHQDKLYHLALSADISRNTLAKANET